MRNAARGWFFGATLALVGGLSVCPETRAQNTYADFPYNQGGLMYRYSGQKPPKTVNSGQTRPTRRLFARNPQYAQPAAPRYYYSQPTVPGASVTAPRAALTQPTAPVRYYYPQGVPTAPAVPTAPR